MTWNGKPTDFNVVVRSDVANFRSKAALYALRGLILRTPVDTGRARGSWYVTVGFAADYDSGAFGTSGQQSTGPATNAAMSRGMASIAASKSQPFTTIYITNSIKYVPFLNFGTRYIAPMRFLEIVFNDLRVKFG